jgi:hypothetical protein
LATFSVTASEKEWDDLSDLSPPEMDSVREWEMQFKGELCFFATLDTVFDVFFLCVFTEKYDLVGRLLKVKLQIFHMS